MQIYTMCDDQRKIKSVLKPIANTYTDGYIKYIQPLDEVKGFLSLIDEADQQNLYLYHLDNNVVYANFLDNIPKTIGLNLNQNYRNTLLINLISESSKTTLCLFLAFKKYKTEAIEIELSYQHVFNQFHWKTSKDGKCIVIITGNYKYGFKKHHYEKCDKYLDVISLKEHGFVHNSRKHFISTVEDISIIDFTFNHNETSILVASNDNTFVFYSLITYEFGEKFKWDRDMCYYSYCQHFNWSNLLFLACPDGETFIAYEQNMFFCEYKKLSLNWKKDLVKPVIGSCGNRFRSIISIYSCDKIYLYDLHQEVFVAELLTTPKLIINPKNWISCCRFVETIFVVGKDKYNRKTVVNVYFLKDDNISLKHLSRKVVLNVHSIEYLKTLNLAETLI